MLVVNYNGNKPISNYFKYSVNGNNNIDVVRFVVLKNQGYIDLSTSDKVSVKYANYDNDFVDEEEIASENVNVADWHLSSELTKQESLEVSLCFQRNSDVWQTQIFKLKIMNGIIIEGE